MVLVFLKKHSLAIGLTAMVLAVLATLVEPGSLLQKTLFLVAVPTLGLAAFLDGHKLFFVLQGITTVSAVMAFFTVPDSAKFFLLGFGVIVGFAFLWREKYFKSDPYWVVGGLGLLGLASGLAMNAVTQPLLFYSFLGLGGLLIAVYSGIQFFYLKVRIAGIWLVLNVLFSLNPLLMALSILGL